MDGRVKIEEDTLLLVCAVRLTHKAGTAVVFLFCEMITDNTYSLIHSNCVNYSKTVMLFDNLSHYIDR